MKIYDNIKKMIFPTAEELAIRISRKEVGEKEQRAISFGIGVEPGKDIAPVDNIPAEHQRLSIAGKAVFAGADVYMKAKIVAENFDKQTQHVNDLKSKPDTS